MDKIAVVFTMKGCPHCVDFKKMLKEADVEYIERDIDEHEEEYEMFIEATGNDFVPAFMLIENPESEKPLTELYAPQRDYDELEDAFNIIKEFYEK